MTSNMWPKILPQGVRTDPRHQAEVQVYDLMASELSNDFHVFYSSPWLATDRYGNEKDGECDFLVAHPDLGLLAVEVKGGGISFDPATDQWTSQDRNRITHNIKDPIQQAKSAKHAILKKMKESGRWRERWIGSRHGVIFPNAARPPSDLGADRPAKLFCCAERLRLDLVGWIRERMTYSPAEDWQSNCLGNDGLDALRRILAFPFTLSFRIAATISEDLDQLALLEPQQYLVLDYISNIRKAEIRGAAGTGKTVLAIEEALRSSNLKRRTALTCYNSPLGKELERRVGHTTEIVAGGFHTICIDLAKMAGLDIPTITGTKNDFDEILPELMMKAIETSPELKFDMFVVDEAQDFRDNWWVAIEYSLADNGRLRVFSDSNQKVYDDRKVPSADFELVPIPLTRNLRNTKNIHKAAIVHYSGPPVDPVGPVGSELNWVTVQDSKDLSMAAYKELKRMVFKEDVSPGDIAILLPDKTTVDHFLSVSAKSSLTFEKAEDVSGEHVIVDTVRRYKGLERPAIILCAGPNAGDFTELAYVGMSRAKVALSVICTEKGKSWLQ